MKTCEALADAFRREHVRTCFALSGDANMHWVGATAERGKTGHGFGIAGKTFEKQKALAKRFDDFLSTPAPAIWDIHISDQAASPQTLKVHKAVHV